MSRALGSQGTPAESINASHRFATKNLDSEVIERDVQSWSEALNRIQEE